MIMKRILMLCVAVGLIATSCIKNEESDGVKAVRLAQAEELQAEAAEHNANATATIADANATDASTALANAKREWEVATAKWTAETARLTWEVTNAGHDNAKQAKAATELAALYTAQSTAAANLYKVNIAKMEAEITLINSYDTKGLSAADIAILTALKADLKVLTDKVANAEKAGGELDALSTKITASIAKIYGATLGTLGGLQKTVQDMEDAVKLKTDAMVGLTGSDLAKAQKELAGLNAQLAIDRIKLADEQAEYAKLTGYLSDAQKNFYAEMEKEIAAVQAKINALLKKAQDLYNSVKE